MTIPPFHVDEIEQAAHIYVCLEYERFCKTSLYYIHAKLYRQVCHGRLVTIEVLLRSVPMLFF